jgi:hypothetical protein
MLHNDDELAVVNSEFLGPSGYTFPWRARYSAYGIAITLGLVTSYVIHRVGLPINLFTIVWSTALIVLATRGIGKVVTFETQLRVLIVILWHEITAPRPDNTVKTTVFRPGKVHVKNVTGSWVCNGCASSPSTRSMFGAARC